MLGQRFHPPGGGRAAVEVGLSGRLVLGVKERLGFPRVAGAEAELLSAFGINGAG